MTFPLNANKPARCIARNAGAIVGVALALNVLAAPPQGLTVSSQWMRFILPTSPAAGYFTLNNSADKAYVLDGVASSACGELMLHRSIREGGVERMTMEMSAEIPAHGSLVFAPGGYHLMCVAPTEALRPGKTVDVTLHFSDGSELSVDFPVRSIQDEQ